MKITDSESIKDGELELIDALTGDLDWGIIEKILREKHKLGLHDEVIYNSGDLVVHKGNIAYKLDFDVKVKLSVLFDRKGQCLSLSTSADLESTEPLPDDISENQDPSYAVSGEDQIQIDEPLFPENDDDELISLEDESSDENEEVLFDDDESDEEILSRNDSHFDSDSENELVRQMNELDDPEEITESNENISQMASQIAEMISEINER